MHLALLKLTALLLLYQWSASITCDGGQKEASELAVPEEGHVHPPLLSCLVEPGRT